MRLILVQLAKSFWSNFGAKARIIAERKLACIALIHTNLRSLRSTILRSFRARNCLKNFWQAALAFLLFTIQVLGHLAVTENEPNSLVEGMVSAVTGDAYVVEDDVIISAAEPLRLKRSYISGKGGRMWWYFETLQADFCPLLNELCIREPNATALYYRCQAHELGKKKKKGKGQVRTFRPLDLHTDGQGLTNTARGTLSGLTNLKNQYVTMEGKIVTVHCPNGGKRIYKLKPPEKKKSILDTFDFRLQTEILPNGNQVVYQWRDDGALEAIRTTDPSEQRTYAQATFIYHGKLKKNKKGEKYVDKGDFDVHTSDGRVLKYRFLSVGKPEDKGGWLLDSVVAPDKPEERVHYLPKNKHRGPILAARTFPESRGLHISYYELDADNPLNACVKTLSSPVGPNATPVVTHRFNYNLAAKKSTVVDVEGVPTHYYWDKELRLIKIDRHSSPEQLDRSVCFVWGSLDSVNAGNLLCKVVSDGKRAPMQATCYIYDACGNVIEEKLYGNLSGQGPPLTVNNNQIPIENGVEVATIRRIYSQEGKNLLLRQEDPNGLVTIYGYLSGTNLPTSVLQQENGITKRRSFTLYDSYRIPICEITDDGSELDPSNLTGVKTRLIRRIQPYTQSPYIGMPHTIEEKYWDGQEEKLLKKTVVTYTTGGKIATEAIYDADHQHRYTLNYTYDEKGRLKTQTNAVGQVATYAYDPLGNPTFFQDFGSKAVTTMTYDCSNRLTQSCAQAPDHPDQITTHRYNTRSQRISTSDFHQYETHYVHDPFGNLLQTQLPSLGEACPALTTAYDAQGFPIIKTDAKGFTTHIQNNARGSPIHIQHPDQTAETLNYYLDGTLKSHCNQNLVDTIYTYDAFGRVTSIAQAKDDETLSLETYAYDSFHLLSQTDAEGNTTTYTYDGAGRLIAEEVGDEKTQFHYDSFGRQNITQTDTLLTISELDLLDRPIEERKEDVEGYLLAKMQYSYDEAGNLKTTTRFICNHPATETLTYDPFNRLVCTQDPLGNQTRVIYDDNNHQQTTVDPLGLQTQETFNSHYQISRLEKYSPSGACLLQENYTYDLNDNLIYKETQLSGRTLSTQWEYGPLDRLLQLTEAGQRITSYTYTPTGKPYQTIKPSGTIITCTYDPLDHLLTQTSSDQSIHYVYHHNRIGQLLFSADQTTHTTLARTYDPQGNLLSETLPTGHTLTNTYDTQGRRVQLELPDLSQITYTYDPLYLRTVSYRNYTHTFLEYDLAQNPLSEQLLGDFGTLHHTYDPLNRITSRLAPNFSQHIRQYDPLGNILISEYNGQLLHYTYDPLYQLTSESTHTYAYDALHNRLQKDATIYTLNALNQLTDQFTYDSNGNPSTSHNARYSYDALDRLIAIDQSDFRLEFAYDSYHRRLTKTHIPRNGRSQTTTYLYDDQNEIGTVASDGTPLELRILANTPQAEIGSAIAMQLNQTLFVPIHDLHGNVALLLSRATTREQRYTAFGEPLAANTSPWGFSSKRTDPETGFVYFGRRYYIPELGRWLTPDPLGYDAGPNLYAYVGNAPLTHTDSYGLFDTWGIEHFLKQPRSELPPLDYKQIGIGSVHGAGDFTLRSIAGMATIGRFVTMPSNSFSWLFGQSSPSQDWRRFEHSRDAFLNTGNRWLQQALPADLNSDTYHAVRFGVSTSLEVGSFFAGGFSLIKNAGSLATRGFSLARPTSKLPFPTNLSHGIPKNVRYNRANWKFPHDPQKLLPELSRDAKGKIFTSDYLRIRPEKHPLKPGEIFNARHHGLHYHVESRIDPNKPWRVGNINKIKPAGYQHGQGTGFLPGEYFPGD